MDSDRNQPLIKEEQVKIYPNISENSQVTNPVYQLQNNNTQPINYPQQQRNQNFGQGYQNQQYINNQANLGNNYGQNINQGNRGPQYNNQPYYQGQNQGYNPNYNQGQMPVFPNQQVMPNVNQERVLIIQQHSSLDCKMCGYNGPSNWRQSAGCATYSWCVCLFCFTGIFGFWIPFCIDSCYDTQIMCARCGFVKGVVPAQCC